MSEILTVFLVIFAAMSFIMALITLIVRLIDVMNKKK